MSDITIEVHPEILAISQFEPGMGLVDQQLIWGKPEAVERAMQNIARAFACTNTHMMGFGLGSLQKSPDDPIDLSHLVAQFDRMDRIGLPKTLTLYNIPAHYKVRVFRGGVMQLLDHPDDHFSDKGRPSPLRFDALIDLMRQVVQLALARGVRTFYVWNEAKGYYNGPAPQTWAVDDYLSLYNAVVDVIEDAVTSAGMSANDVRIGGPYVPIRVQTSRNASSLPASHPLNGAWGGVKKEAIHFLERFVQEAKRLDLLVIDMGLGLTQGEPLVDEFANCARFTAIVNYVQEVAQQAGWPVPVELAELYLAPQDAALKDSRLRAAVAAEALRRLVEAGIGAAFAWGFRHGGESALLTPTDTPDGGAPLPVWEVWRNYKDHFSRGHPIHKLTIKGEGASAIANDSEVLVINHSTSLRTLSVNGKTHALAAYEQLLIPWEN